VVATAEIDGQGFVRLLVVDPAQRGKGHGHALLEAAEADLTGLPSVTVGTDAPYFLYPGVETTETGMLVLLERHHYDRVEANYNMAIDLRELPPDPGGHFAPTPDKRDEVDQWMATHWFGWRLEVLRAFDKGTLLMARDDDGISAFCAYNVNRAGLIGPVAARFDLIGKGAAAPVVAGVLHRLPQPRSISGGDGRRPLQDPVVHIDFSLLPEGYRLTVDTEQVALSAAD